MVHSICAIVTSQNYHTPFLESPTIDSFGNEMKLTEDEVHHMNAVLEGITAGASSEMSANEAADFRFFAQKLQETGFF